MTNPRPAPVDVGDDGYLNRHAGTDKHAYRRSGAHQHTASDSDSNQHPGIHPHAHAVVCSPGDDDDDDCERPFGHAFAGSGHVAMFSMRVQDLIQAPPWWCDGLRMQLDNQAPTASQRIRNRTIIVGGTHPSGRAGCAFRTPARWLDRLCPSDCRPSYTKPGMAHVSRKPGRQPKPDA